MNIEQKINELKRQKRIHNLPEIITDTEMKKLESNMPIQKILGFINFDDLVININRDVLIPRYETQEVVNEALKYISENSKVLDLCAGSGYIGLTIKQKTNADVTLSDISQEAIEQIKENAEINNLHVTVIQSNMFDNINSCFDVIVSNPPYIPTSVKLDKSVVDYEPHIALFGGVDGNNFYEIIFSNFKKYLKVNGMLILEMSEDNANFLMNQGCIVKTDINGKKRIAVFKNTQP